MMPLINTTRRWFTAYFAADVYAFVYATPITPPTLSLGFSHGRKWYFCAEAALRLSIAQSTGL